MVVLVAFDVLDEYFAGELSQSANDSVCYVPISLESAVWETLWIWAGGRDAVDERIVVTAKSDCPVWAGVAEQEQVV